MNEKRFLIALSMVLLTAPALAADTEITFDPPGPRPSEEITITATYVTNCFNEATVEVDGRVITVTAVEGCICPLSVAQPVSFSVTVGPLALGVYAVELIKVRKGGDVACSEPELLAEKPLGVSASATFSSFSTEPATPTADDRVLLSVHSLCPAAFDPVDVRGTLVSITELNVGFGAPCFTEPRYHYDFDLGVLPEATYTVQLLWFTDGVPTINLEDSFAVTAATGDELLLHDGRFRAELSWRDPQGDSGPGRAVTLTQEAGYFWFFNSGNVEVVLKVLDGRAWNGCFWVFGGTMSNVEYTISITDTQTQELRTYINAQGRFSNIGDTFAFCSE
ncbi:MAG: hypothetical protein GY856_04015 [bacterium]|nr:hypothetical protein [bacterium]